MNSLYHTVTSADVNAFETCLAFEKLRNLITFGLFSGVVATILALPVLYLGLCFF